MQVVNKVKVELVCHMGSDTNVVNAARVSFDKRVEEFDAERDFKLLKYLAKHKHWSPFAHTSITVRCSVPIFLARQLVKHQVGLSWNEESRRYIDSPVEIYLPDDFHVRPDSVKQGSGEIHGNHQYIRDTLEIHYNEAVDLYEDMLNDGVAPEEARMVLPLSAMTNYVWTGSVMAFARVIEQRSHPGAQLIAREFAQELTKAIEQCYPYSLAALLQGDSK